MPFDLLDNLFLLGFLLFLELILNVDNMVIIAMIASYVASNMQKMVQVIGLSLAFLFRVALVFSLTAVLQLEQGFFTIGTLILSIKDILMLLGAIFLMYKATSSIIELLHIENSIITPEKYKLRFLQAIIQIAFIDCIFSLDSIITAISVTKNTTIILLVIIISMLGLLIFSSLMIKLVNQYRSIKMIAFLFIFLIGIDLFLEAIHIYTNKYYLYSGMVLGLIVNSIYFFVKKYKNKY